MLGSREMHTYSTEYIIQCAIAFLMISASASVETTPAVTISTRYGFLGGYRSSLALSVRSFVGPENVTRARVCTRGNIVNFGVHETAALKAQRQYESTFAFARLSSRADDRENTGRLIAGNYP